MVPVVPHPFRVFANHLGGVKMHLILGAVPIVAGPDKIFVLNQQASFIRDVEPLIRYRTDAEPKTIPVHLARNLDEQFADPRLIPRQGARQRIFKKPMERDVRTAHEVDVAVQVCAPGGGIEAELPHAEASRGRVATGTRLQHI